MVPDTDRFDESDWRRTVESLEVSADDLEDSVSISYDAETESYRFELEEEVPLEVSIVGAVATVRRADPLELEPLAEWIDVDSLDGLFGSLRQIPGGRATVSFPYAGCWVTAESGDSITVSRRNDSQ